MQVRPQYPTGDPVGEIEHVMMIVPVDGDDDEAEYVGEKYRQESRQRGQVGAVGHLKLQHHDRDEDRDHSIAERAQPFIAHRVACSMSPRLDRFTIYRGSTGSEASLRVYWRDLVPRSMFRKGRRDTRRCTPCSLRGPGTRVPRE